MYTKRPNRRQMDFHTSLEYEERYVARDNGDALKTMIFDAIIHTLEFPTSFACIFTRNLMDTETVRKALPDMARGMARFKWLTQKSGIKWSNGSVIEIRHVGLDQDSLWKLAGAEWQWIYFYKDHLFTDTQVKYIKTRARFYPRTHYYSIRSISIPH